MAESRHSPVAPKRDSSRDGNLNHSPSEAGATPAPGSDAAWLLGRTYTDEADGLWTDFPSPEAEPFFATCGYCGWDGPSRETRAEAERDRWRHPDVLCWLRALWFDYGPRRLA